MHEPKTNPYVQAVTVMVTVSRAVLDEATDWLTLCPHVDPILLDWGLANRHPLIGGANTEKQCLLWMENAPDVLTGEGVHPIGPKTW